MGSSKIKIFVFGKDKTNWSIDKDRKAVVFFLRENGFIITSNVFEATHIFCVWYDLLFNFKYRWLNYFKNIFNKKLITVITNDITFTPDKVNFLKKFVDICIAPSEKIFNFLRERGIKAYKIPFFIDPQLFKPLKLSKQKICEKLGIDYKKIENKLVIGSFQRDSLGKNLKKPKWQKNPDLLISILEKLPREVYILLLAGPRRHYIVNRCEEKKIPYMFYGNDAYIKRWEDDIYINNLSPSIINLLYNLSDVYIVTSKSEGGPKQVLESSLTKTLIFSTKVSLAPDILHPYLLFEENEVQLLIEKIKKFFDLPASFDKYIEFNFQKTQNEMKLETLKEKYKRVILDA